MKFFIIILLSLLTPSCGKWEKMTSKDIKEDCMQMEGDNLELVNCGKATFYAKPEDDKFAFDISDCGEGFLINFNGKTPPVQFLGDDMTNVPSLNLVVLTDGRVTGNKMLRPKIDAIIPGTDGVVKIYVNPDGDCTLLLVKGHAMFESSAAGALAANTKLILIVGGALVGVILLVLLIGFVYKFCKRTRRVF